MATGSLQRSHPARWWRTEKDGRILCTLCPRYCKVKEGQPGFCYIRQNHGGKLVSVGYGRPTGFAVDPIEKKPLSHFLPGTPVLSFGTAGCNLGCKFCQNWDISKAKIDEFHSQELTPGEVVALAIREECPSIAYTYNDPVIFGEYVIDISKEAHAAGLRNVMVTAGYITPEARPEVFEHIDAANVDLKAFTETFYHKVTSSHLDPVLDTLKWLHRETEIWFEITTLLIPGLNDSESEIRQECDWLVENVGPDVPLHFTAFHPDFKLRDRGPTPHATLTRARTIAVEAGLRYVYVGNVHDEGGQTTFCPGCGAAVIRRNWHSVYENRLRGPACPDCGTAISGVFDPDPARWGRGPGRPRPVFY
jgi:pyruvate formate lyase activating enzyme